MATILTFRPGEMRRDARDFRCAAASAEVIVFPGVRYERWGEAGDAQAQLAGASKKRSPSRQRDVLELAD